MTTSHHPMIIKCVSLRQLHLEGLGIIISQNILDGIFSSCSLLEKVKLSRCCKYLNTIKLKNLPCLYELEIQTDIHDEESTDFVISHLPNLLFFSCTVYSRYELRPFNAHSISLGCSVTKLSLRGLGVDNSSLDMINSGSPFLESLTLDMTSWTLARFHFTSASIKTLFLHYCGSSLIDVQIHAPKLSHFKFDGYALPATLLFPVSSTLNQLDILLEIDMCVDASFFLKLRETLTLSRKCYLNIETYNVKTPMDIHMNDLRRKLLLPPARNVQRLWFETDGDKCQWKQSPFFDALFEICHPEQVVASWDKSFKYNNHFCRLMFRTFLVNRKKTGRTVSWPRYLEHVQIKDTDPHENWETLTNSHRSLLDGSTPYVHMLFKLKWR